MIDVQNKPSAFAKSIALRNAGSVPSVMPPVRPQLLPPAETSNYPALRRSVDELSSFLLIVVVPSAFWMGLTAAIAWCASVDVSHTALISFGLAIATFLAVIRASLVVDRSM
jgi:hypothetical protein